MSAMHAVTVPKAAVPAIMAALEAAVLSTDAGAARLAQTALGQLTVAPKRAKAGGPHWSDFLGEARRNAAAEHGPNWHLAPGASVWVHLVGSTATHTTARGTKVKWLRDMRVPVASFWPGGAFPADFKVSFGTGAKPTSSFKLGDPSPGYRPITVKNPSWGTHVR